MSNKSKNSKFIFVTGGVVSSLGKGISAASLAALLQCHGYSTRLKKLDPYLNIDSGTMSPTQHGEVFVTEDGGETDLDLGHYERFTGINASKNDNTTAGKIYLKLLANERKGSYLGKTVQVIPHVTNLIKEFILDNIGNEDFIICEIGGTVGDIEAEPFIETIRQLANELPNGNSIFIHLTLIPYLKAAKELKTKPTQHSVKELRSRGIQPHILICRTEKAMKMDDKDKIALFCNVSKSSVFEAVDQQTIYNVVLDFYNQGLDQEVLKHLGIVPQKANIQKWQEYITKSSEITNEIKIAVIGKYNLVKDSYKSLMEALTHAGVANNVKVRLVWINTNHLNEKNLAQNFVGINGVLVPGGFGARGADGKILAIKYARENNIPFLGICLGMQLAVIEFARNILNIKDASSTEFGSNCTKIIARMSEWQSDNQKIIAAKEDDDMGGTMRLGSFPCLIQKDSLARGIYQLAQIQERHRHRYEFNIQFKDKFFGSKMQFSGMSPDGQLVEIVELIDHPFFIAVQYHPELKSTPFKPHPLFNAFIQNSVKI
jgi:CTP synthase